MSANVLIVDDEKNLTTVVKAILERAGFKVMVFNDSVAASRHIKSAESDSDILITDLYMPNLDGMQILEDAKKHWPRTPVILMTAFGTIEAAVQALKKGAFDFVTKPFEQKDLVNTVKKAFLTRKKLLEEIVAPITGPSISTSTSVNPSVTPGEVSAKDESDLLNATQIVGQNEKIKEIFKVISKVAASPSSVLIQGESGTGKELIAFEIHRLSDRSEKPFIKINCAAIPATLIESELFGYEKGAFTGAVSSKPGRFELADGGTLFLDEVADTPIEMQVKLLRVLQEQEFERVGGIETKKVNVRIIAASNKNLSDEIKAGRFREDLFYRLNVVPISLPPLRERISDIEPLTRHFISAFNTKLGKKIKSLDVQCLKKFEAYAWPGNIRQLENVLERMVLMSDHDVLMEEDLPPEVKTSVSAGHSVMTATDSSFVAEKGDLKEIVKRHTQSLERELIEKALGECEGNVTKTAEKLGLSRKGLQLKMKELGLTSGKDSN